MARPTASTVRLGQEALEAPLLAEAVAQHVGLGVTHEIGQILVRGKLADQAHDRAGICG